MRYGFARLSLAATSRAIAAVILSVAIGSTVATLGAGNLGLAVAVGLLPLVPVLILHTQAAAVAALACLPFEINVVGGAIGVNVAPADFLLSAVLAGLLVALNANVELRERLSALRPVLPLLGVYFGAALVVTVGNPSLAGIIALVQRIEVVCVPMLIGAIVLTGRSARTGMVVFIASALLLGLVFIVPHASSGGVLGVQKNPAGQYIVDAALITLVAFNANRFRFAVIPVLIVAAYATQSRGAMIGLAAGLVMFVLLRSRGPFQAAARAIPLAALMLGGFYLLPASVQARMLGNTLASQHNDSIRKAYIADAWHIFSQHPIMGVGIGNYLSGSQGTGSLTNDPHNILLLEAAEGGGILIIGFLVLQVGALIVVFRRFRQSPWAIPAICVQVAILVHAQVDVYWVRGTPDIGWLLIGLALAPLGRSPATPVSPAAEARQEMSAADGTSES